MSDASEDDLIIRGKLAMDGAATLGEAARMLRDYARDLETMEAQGWQLRSPVEEDYGFVYETEETPGPQLIGVREAARRLGVHENTVRNWMDRGILPFKQQLPSGYRKLDPADVERLRT